MTKISIYTDQNQQMYGFRIEGHAGYANYGKDVVCAAVSVLSINTVNSLEELLHKEVKVTSDSDKGFMDVKVDSYEDDKTQLLLESFRLGITEIAQQYPKFLKLDK